MRKSIRTIGIITTIGFMLGCAYLLSTAHQKTNIEIKIINGAGGIVPDGYIPLNKCIPLSDVACYYIDENGYLGFALKDVNNQLDNDNNRSYADIMDGLTDKTKDFKNNFIDMNRVTDYTADDNGLQIFLDDGTGYYWER